MVWSLEWVSKRGGTGYWGCTFGLAFVVSLKVHIRLHFSLFKSATYDISSPIILWPTFHKTSVLFRFVPSFPLVPAFKKFYAHVKHLMDCIC